MFIPRYWYKVSAETVTPEGKDIAFELWRGSRDSRADAQRQAQAAAERMAHRIQRGEGFPERYTYGDRPMREEIVHEIDGGPDGQPAAVITRNAYGSLVLNTPHVGFIDVDLPEKKQPAVQKQASAVQSFFRQLLFRQPPKPQEPPADPSFQSLLRLQTWIEKHPDWGVRVYCTKAGLRYLVTHAPMTPGDSASDAAMEVLEADPFYRKLCRVQKSFRARLTPKPWRVGIEQPPARFPWETAKIEQAMRDWEKQYHEVIKGFATCTLIEVHREDKVHPLVAPIIELHDRATRANEKLPLA